MTYTPRIPSGSKYSLYTADGNAYNPQWKGSIVDMLTALVADVDQSAEERERAAKALKFYAERIAAEGEATPINLGVAKMFAQQGAQMLWESPEDCMFSTKVWEDGVTRTNILSKKYHHRVAAPVEIDIQDRDPNLAIPAPVLAPSAQEVQAISQYRSKSADEVTATVEAISKNEVKPLSAIEEVEQQMRQRRDLQDRIAANERELARLRALRDSA